MQRWVRSTIIRKITLHSDVYLNLYVQRTKRQNFIPKIQEMALNNLVNGLMSKEHKLLVHQWFLFSFYEFYGARVLTVQIFEEKLCTPHKCQGLKFLCFGKYNQFYRFMVKRFTLYCYDLSLHRKGITGKVISLKICKDIVIEPDICEACLSIFINNFFCVQFWSQKLSVWRFYK